MPAIIETTESISSSMDLLIDFIVTDEFLGAEFEDFLIKNKIEIQKESELNDVLIGYLLEGKTKDGIRVLDYFLEKENKADRKIIKALKESFVSVFQINKILKNGFETVDLISEKEYTLIPLVKTTNLRGIGLYDYIKARAVEIDNNYYLLEIYETLGQFREYFANAEAVKSIIKNPKIAVLNNREKLLEIKNSISGFHSTFTECFKGDEIIVSNKEADRLLNDFYEFHTGKINSVEFTPLKPDFDYKFFEIKEFNNDFLLNAATGFKASEKEYDTGFYSDFEFGFFVIPFLGTFNKILSNDGSYEIEGENECIRDFLLNDRVSPNLLKKKAGEFKNFVEIINRAVNKNFKTADEIIDFYKYDYKDGLRLSPMSVLYNSKAFSKVLGHKEPEKIKIVGRNDLCPCGSGKKFKKCCLNKIGE